MSVMEWLSKKAVAPETATREDRGDEIRKTIEPYEIVSSAPDGDSWKRHGSITGTRVVEEGVDRTCRLVTVWFDRYLNCRTGESALVYRTHRERWHDYPNGARLPNGVWEYVVEQKIER